VHKIEYGNGFFNWQLPNLSEWLDNQDIDYQWNFNEYDGGAEFEIETDEMEEAIKAAREADERVLFDGWTGNDVADALSAMLKEADTTDGCVHASYF
jgi:hypothetical protein